MVIQVAALDYDAWGYCYLMMRSPNTELKRPDAWPPLPYDAWKDTYATLHMWTQKIGRAHV